MDISLESKSSGIRGDYQVGLPFRSKAEVSSETIRRDYQLEAKVEVSGGIIRWVELLEVKQRYQVDLSDGITILSNGGGIRHNCQVII